jgi:hypothetical protein
MFGGIDPRGRDAEDVTQPPAALERVDMQVLGMSSHAWEETGVSSGSGT